MKAFYK